jgi:hypothetical protein
MSTVMDSVFPVANTASEVSIDVRPATPSIVSREGDWQAYLERTIGKHSGTREFPDTQALTEYKQQCAFDYLGKRAQKHGGVCSKKPRVLAPEVVARLEESNRSKRFARYPWIEKLLKLMSEIEKLQEESAASQNVFSLVQPSRTGE